MVAAPGTLRTRSSETPGAPQGGLDQPTHRGHDVAQCSLNREPRCLIGVDGLRTVAVVERDTGERREAQVFVAVLGASNYTYAEATWTQTLPDWCASHVRAFEFFGGCPELLIPDNLRSAVSRAHRYEPDTNPTYHDLACHYAVAVLPARWKKARVNIDYHVEVLHHYYCVPHALVGRQLDVRLTATTVECFDRGQRVASHMRCARRGRHTTADEHMPEKHRKMGQWSPERFIGWASTIGPDTAALIDHVLRSRRHPQQAFRSCLGILRLGRSYGEARLEGAAGRALALGAYSYRSVESILKHRLDERPSEQIEFGLAIEHTNIRGASYYQ